MNTRAEHLIIFSLLTPFIFVFALMMHHWNTNAMQMIETIRTIEMMHLNINDASMQMNGALWCGVVSVGDVDVASMEPIEASVSGMSGGMSGANVASMEPIEASMSSASGMSGGVEWRMWLHKQFI